jgi:high-affinity nickel-transport protein
VHFARVAVLILIRLIMVVSPEPLLAPKLQPARSTAKILCRSAGLLIGAILLFTALTALSIFVFLPPSMASLGVLAYCFGARHGVDADHIAAIDNVTRNLVASGQRPVSVGFYFSLGHCAIVFGLCGVVVLGSEASDAQLKAWASAGSTVGPWIAAAVLLVIGSVNLCAARDLFAQWRNREARGHAHEIASLVGRCCPSCLAAIDQPWKVCYIGLLFGLGLDTAAEVGLLSLSALAQPGVPRACAFVLPALFAAGMSLVDSLNGLLMLWAYEWAAEHGPMSRLYFSLFLTLASATLALLVGLVEALGQLATLWSAAALRDASGIAAVGARVLEAARWLSEHLELLGAGSVAAFFVAIVGAVVLAPYCTVGLSEIEAAKQAQGRSRLRNYLQRGEYIVRVVE